MSERRSERGNTPDSKKPAYEVVMDIYSQTIERNLSETGMIGTTSIITLGVCAEVLQKSDIPSEALPQILETLQGLQESCEELGDWKPQLLTSVTNLQAILNPPPLG